MSKLLYHELAREAIRRGVGQLARTVSSTLGPRGHMVMLANSFGPPTVTKDVSPLPTKFSMREYVLSLAA